MVTTTTGPRAGLPEPPAPAGGSHSTDFIALATNVHSQAFIIVNYGSSTSKEAAYAVRMFNVTNHSNFKYWEIGNENFGTWETDNNTNAPFKAHDPWTYAMRFTNYYAQMKAVDPTIKIGAVIDPTEDGYTNYTTIPWSIRAPASPTTVGRR